MLKYFFKKLESCKNWLIFKTRPDLWFQFYLYIGSLSLNSANIIAYGKNFKINNTNKKNNFENYFG